jgi:uncharacterized metal-binding protein
LTDRSQLERGLGSSTTRVPAARRVDAGDERVDVGVVQQDLVRAASSGQQTVMRVDGCARLCARIAGVASSVSPICSG